jgi:hypothetical protein
MLIQRIGAAHRSITVRMSEERQWFAHPARTVVVQGLSFIEEGSRPHFARGELFRRKSLTTETRRLDFVSL